MADSWETLKLLADSTRIRILSLLTREELSVAELQEVLDMGQSRISSHLGLLRQGELVHAKVRRWLFYALNRRFDPQGLALMEAACASVDGSEQIVSDHANLKRIFGKAQATVGTVFLIPSLGAYVRTIALGVAGRQLVTSPAPPHAKRLESLI